MCYNRARHDVVKGALVGRLSEIRTTQRHDDTDITDAEFHD
jgi:hypothetical protein